MWGLTFELSGTRRQVQRLRLGQAIGQQHVVLLVQQVRVLAPLISCHTRHSSRRLSSGLGVFTETARSGSTVGMLVMEDDGGVDEKVLCVPHKDPRWSHIQDLGDVSAQVKNEIEHFFSHYKDLEPGKWVKVGEWQGKDVAERLIQEALVRYNTEGEHKA